MTPKKEPILGQNTPITLGIVASIVAMAVGIGVTAGTVNKDLATVNLKIDAIERRELSGAKYQIDQLPDLQGLKRWKILEGARTSLSLPSLSNRP